MPFTAQLNTRGLDAAFKSIDSNMSFAAARALNEVATTFQANERGVMQQDFMIRRPWVLQGVKINRGDFATKDKLRVRVVIDDARSFMDKFEEGGTRSPLASKALSVPMSARPSPASVVPNRLRPKALGFGSPMPTKSGGQIIKGANGTFIIQNADGSGVILQRKGRKIAVKKRQHRVLMLGQRHDDALVVLYRLSPRTRVPASLHFYRTAQDTFARTWSSAWLKWWNEAVRTASKGSTPQGMALPAGWQE